MVTRKKPVAAAVDVASGQHGANENQQQRRRPVSQAFDGGRVIAFERIHHQRHQSAHHAGEQDNRAGVYETHRDGGALNIGTIIALRLVPVFGA